MYVYIIPGAIGHAARGPPAPPRDGGESPRQPAQGENGRADPRGGRPRRPHGHQRRGGPSCGRLCQREGASSRISVLSTSFYVLLVVLSMQCNTTFQRRRPSSDFSPFCLSRKPSAPPTPFFANQLFRHIIYTYHDATADLGDADRGRPRRHGAGRGRLPAAHPPGARPPRSHPRPRTCVRGGIGELDARPRAFLFADTPFLSSPSSVFRAY